jgi:hypothetical protein
MEGDFKQSAVLPRRWRFADWHAVMPRRYTWHVRPAHSRPSSSRLLEHAMNSLRFAALISLAAMVALCIPAGAAEPGNAGKLRMVIIDGQNNHNWRDTTPYLKQALEESGRFDVEVASFLKPGDKPGSVPSVELPPNLDKYHVALSNYNGQPWPEEFQQALEQRLHEGKIGLVVFHGANNPFASWTEFNRMIAMGWRGNSFGDRLYVDSEGMLIRAAKGQGPGAGETSKHPFVVAVRDADHPITKGLPEKWMHTADQLVHGLRGPAENVHLLATAWSDPQKKGTGQHELMMWTVAYGKGRVFHTPMGHDTGGLKCVGLSTVLLRGCEWAATGSVTIAVPANFPTAEATRSY